MWCSMTGRRGLQFRRRSRVSALKPRPLYLRFEDDDLMIDDDAIEDDDDFGGR